MVKPLAVGIAIVDEMTADEDCAETATADETETTEVAELVDEAA